MVSKFHYIGLFLDKEELLNSLVRCPGRRLQKVIEHPHVTLRYMPESVDIALFGKEVEIIAVGYANDGVNEGLLVELREPGVDISALAEKVAVPHITISVGKYGKPVRTSELNFEPIPYFRLTGVFGGEYNGKVYLSQEAAERE